MNGYKTVFTSILTIVLLMGMVGCGGQAEEPVVTPPSPTAVTAPATTEEPEEVVQQFFNWYLAYAETSNPLVDKAYHDSPYLTADLVSQVDEIVASFEGGGYDPFLCAQDVPDYVMTQSLIMNGQTPIILVQTSFDHHFFTVDLRQMDGDIWQISNVTCGRGRRRCFLGRDRDGDI